MRQSTKKKGRWLTKRMHSHKIIRVFEMNHCLPLRFLEVCQGYLKED